MSRGPGRIERAIRALFDAHPDEAFTTDTLCRACYPDARSIQHKHVVAMTRAMHKVVARDPNWHARMSAMDRRTWDFCNRASVPSMMARVPASLAPEKRAEVERRVHLRIAVRDGDVAEAEAERLRALPRPEHKSLDQIAQEIRTILGRPTYVLTKDTGGTCQHLAEIAALARRLITENDPDAIRAGLAEIADTLDAFSAPTTPP